MDKQRRIEELTLQLETERAKIKELRRQHSSRASVEGEASAAVDRMESPASSAAFSVHLLVLVVNDRDGVQHCVTLQLPRLPRAAASRTEELQEAAGMGVHAVELTPATLAPVLAEGEEEPKEDEGEDERILNPS